MRNLSKIVHFFQQSSERCALNLLLVSSPVFDVIIQWRSKALRKALFETILVYVYSRKLSCRIKLYKITVNIFNEAR